MMALLLLLWGLVCIIAATLLLWLDPRVPALERQAQQLQDAAQDDNRYAAERERRLDAQNRVIESLKAFLASMKMLPPDAP